MNFSAAQLLFWCYSSLCPPPSVSYFCGRGNSLGFCHRQMGAEKCDIYAYLSLYIFWFLSIYVIYTHDRVLLTFYWLFVNFTSYILIPLISLSPHLCLFPLHPFICDKNLSCFYTVAVVNHTANTQACKSLSLYGFRFLWAQSQELHSWIIWLFCFDFLKEMPLTFILTNVYPLPQKYINV